MITLLKRNLEHEVSKWFIISRVSIRDVIGKTRLMVILLESIKMADLQIKTGQLKSIRVARKIGRPKLAKQVGISERQLAKIEKSETAKLSSNTVSRLSEALQISTMTLTGEFPVSESDLQPIKKPKCTTGCCS